MSDILNPLIVENNETLIHVTDSGTRKPVVDEARLLPNNATDNQTVKFGIISTIAAPVNLTSNTSDPNWEVSCNRKYNTGRDAWHAFDGDTSTYWNSGSSGQVGDWLQWRWLGEGGILLRKYAIGRGPNSDRPTAWKIQGSNDGLVWVDLDTQTGQEVTQTPVVYTIPNNRTSYKYHRFYLLEWVTSCFIGTFEAWSYISSTTEAGSWNLVDFPVIDETRLLPSPANYDLTKDGWLVGLSVSSPSDRPEYLCLYTLDGLVGERPADVTGKTTAVDKGTPLIVVEDSRAFEGKAMRRSSTQSSSATNYLSINMPQITGPFTVDIRFKAGAGSPGLGSDGTTFALGGPLVNTPAGNLGYYTGDVTPFHAVQFSALGYSNAAHSLPWKVLGTADWYWMRICRSNAALYVFMNGEKINSTSNSDALITIPAGEWKFLPSYYDADVLVDEVLITNTCMSTEDYTVPTTSYGQLLREWKLYQDIDWTRLLPDLDSVEPSKSGHPVVFDYQPGIIDADTLCLLHLDDSTWADATGKNTPTQHGSVAKVSSSGYFDKALDLSGNLSDDNLSWLTIPWISDYNVNTWTMEFFAKPTKSVANFMFFSFGTDPGTGLSLRSIDLANLQIGNGGLVIHEGNFNFSLNTWYWFVVQYDGSAVKAYVDGQLVVQGNFTPNYASRDLQLGNLALVNSSEATFIGYLDEFRWSKGLRYPTGVMEIPTQPFGSPTVQYKVSEEPYATEQTITDLTGTVTALTTRVTNDEKWLLPTTASDKQLVQYRQSSGKWVAIPTTDIITEEQLGKIDSLTFADNLTFTADELDEDYVYTKNAASAGLPYGSMVQLVDATTGAVLTNADGVTIEWTSAGDLRIDFSAYYQAVVYGESTSSSSSNSFDEFRVSAGRIYTGDSFTPPTAPLEVESTTQTLSTTVEAAEPIALTADIAGSFEVKFAGNFVSNAATTGGGTAKAIAYPLLLKMDPYDKPMHLEIQYSKDAGYATTTPLINTKTTASDRVYVMGDGGTSFEQCPETGFPPEVFSNAPIMVNMAKLGTLDGFYYIRYRWLSTTDTAVSDWYRTVYPAYTDIGF